MTQLKPGERVRTTITLTSAPGFPPEDAIPTGSTGTITDITPRGEYNVAIDGHTYSSHVGGIHFSADEIEEA